MKNQYIIIRGPLGCGKSTISSELANRLNAEYFSVDKIIDENPDIETKEEGYISRDTFNKVNDILAPKAKMIMDSGRPVIFDGNFYWESVIEDLIEKLGDYAGKVFTLSVSVDTCIKRDAERGETYGEDATKDVHKKSTSFDFGLNIDAEKKSVMETVDEIFEVLNE